MRKEAINKKLNQLESNSGLYPFIGTFLEHLTREECLSKGGLFTDENGNKEYYYRDGTRCYPERIPQKKGELQMIIIRHPKLWKREDEKRNQGKIKRFRA